MALNKLKLNQKRLLKRLYFAKNYLNHLNVGLQENENLKDWYLLTWRKANFELGKLRMKIQKQEEIQAGIVVKISCWEGVN